MDEIELTLNSPLTEEQWDVITDVDFDHTNSIWFHTKHGKQVEFVKAKPVTSNADRIRAMSNEEIAAIICAGCPPGEKCYVCTTGGCGDCWFDWLQSPVGGDVNG